MALMDDLRRFFSPMDRPLPPKPGADRYDRELMAQRHVRSMPEARAIDSFTTYPDWDTQVLAAMGLSNRPWRAASIREALGTPAIFRAVTLISNTTGSLAVEAYRKGVKLDDEDTPKLVKRPDPFRIPRDFYRDTAFYMASRGEFWWWIAKRDFDNSAMSLIAVPPWEVRVEQTKDRLRPRIMWRDAEMPRDDMILGTFLPDEASPAGPFQRGVGPLQLCGAAASVAVESTEWAANFYAGGKPSYLIKAAGTLSEDPETAIHEADTIRTAVMGRDPNTPMVIDEGIEEVKDFPVDPQGGQMLEARHENKGDAANMFGIPGELLEYGRPGSSLTYQNVDEVFTRFVKTPLVPDYLEPIEQHLSDLLPRSTVARFNVKGFLRASPKTRWEIYEIAGRVIGPDEAAAMAREGEGMVPGDVEFAPVPFAPPAAIPSRLPIEPRAALVAAPGEVRCDGTRVRNGIIQKCGKLLAADWRGKCPRCKKEYGTEVRSEEPDVRAMLDDLPLRVAAAIPAPIVTFDRGAFQIDVHTPGPVPTPRRVIERDADGRMIALREETA
jgi:phage portal protein BeeE